MEAICSSEASLDFYHANRLYISEDTVITVNAVQNRKCSFLMGLQGSETGSGLSELHLVRPNCPARLLCSALMSTAIGHVCDVL
jgi:hypothetical protein